MGDCWAVVIGINRYWRRDACLNGARNDALRMCKWLLQSRPDGAGIPPRQLFVVLDADSPDHTPMALPPSVNVIEDATKGRINDVLERVYQKSDGVGERFYFFFAGHGVMVLDNGSPQSAIVAGDFNESNTENSLSLRSILDYFRSMEFADQFFFIDACRNIPWEGKLRVGTAPWPKDRPPTAPPAQQFVFFATSPGVQAGEIDLAGSERGGAFSEALLKGLNGKGAAKAYDPDTRQHLVRWDLLVTHVLNDVVARRIDFSKDPKRQKEARLIQTPQDAEGARGSTDQHGRPRETNPVLARFDPARFSPETLEVLLEPDTVCSVARVSVHEAGEPKPVQSQVSIERLPVIFPLPPRHYIVVAEAAGYDPVQTRRTVPVYEPRAVTLTWKARGQPGSAAIAPQQPFAPHEVLAAAQVGDALSVTEALGGPDEESSKRHRAEAAASESAAPGSGPIDASAAASRSLGDWPPAEPPMPPDATPADSIPPTNLTVDPSDGLALVDVVDTTGKVVRSQHGRLVYDGIRPGAYTVRLRTPEGETADETIDLMPGERRAMSVAAPTRDDTPLMRHLRQTTGFHLDEKNMLHVSERVGAMAAGELSTVLTLAGTLATYPRGAIGWGNRLRRLGLRGPAAVSQTAFGGDGSASGLYLVLGDELAGRSSVLQAQEAARVDLRQVRVGLFAAQTGNGAPPEAIHDQPLAPTPFVGVAEFAAARPAGAYLLLLDAPGRSPTLFGLTLLPSRLTFVVFHRRPNLDVHVFQYFPRLHPQAGTPFDPQHARALELMQRYYLRGRFADMGDPARLLELTWSEPLGGFMAGYLFLRQGRVADASRVAARLVDDFPMASDGYVIRAECDGATGHSEHAIDGYRAALERGLPTFVEGLARLWGKIPRYGIDHPRVKAVNDACQNRVPGLIWTAFTPPARGASDAAG
jgi:caspase domain-containing protein